MQPRPTRPTPTLSPVPSVVSTIRLLPPPVCCLLPQGQESDRLPGSPLWEGYWVPHPSLRSLDLSQCLSIRKPVLVCVCVAGSPISGSFSTLLPSAFLVLVELRPTPPQSNTAKNLCMCQGSGVGSSSNLWGSIVFTVVWGLAYLCQWWRMKRQYTGSARVLGDTAGSHSGTEVKLQAHSLCYLGGSCLPRALLFSPKLCLHWWGRRSSGRGITGLVKRTGASGAKVGTFEARWGSPAASELGLERAVTPATVRSVRGGTQPLSCLIEASM